VVKYIERNPVRANIVNSIEEYHWSSARSHLFGWPDEILIGDDWLAERDRVRYGQFLKDSKKDREEIIRKSTRSGKPLGTANFISTIEKLLDRDLQSKRHGKPSVGKR
jgi:putative transposase